MDGDLAELIKRSGSDRLGKSVPQDELGLFHVFFSQHLIVSRHMSRNTLLMFYNVIPRPTLLTSISKKDGDRPRSITRSLPQDVYIRRKNDHPAGQGRIYTANLNFVSTHLSKPGHRSWCCCMSPRCLLCQFIDRCFLSWVLFIEKTVKQFTYASRSFCPNGGNSVVDVSRCDTSWYEPYV